MSLKGDLLMMKGLISDMPEEDQLKIKSLLTHLRDVVKSNGDNGMVALGVLSIELAIESEQ